MCKKNCVNATAHWAIFKSHAEFPQFNSIIRPQFGRKSLSILQSSFKNVLWLEVDCIPLVDPEELLGNENFQFESAIFWPDLTGVQYDQSEVSIWPNSSLWNGLTSSYKQTNGHILGRYLNVHSESSLFYNLVLP